MAKVIYIDAPEKEDKKKVEFTHYLHSKNGWQESSCNPIDYSKVVYLGKCSIQGDMFVAYSTEITIYKGNLNSGEY